MEQHQSNTHEAWPATGNNQEKVQREKKEQKGGKIYPSPDKEGNEYGKKGGCG